MVFRDTLIRKGNADGLAGGPHPISRTYPSGGAWQGAWRPLTIYLRYKVYLVVSLKESSRMTLTIGQVADGAACDLVERKNQTEGRDRPTEDP